MSRRRKRMILFLCLAVFFTASAVAWGIFEAMPHLEDEHANLFQARVFASGSVAAPAPPDSDAFLVPFAIVHDGIWFGKYTPGYPLVLALGVLLGAPWAVNALASALALFGAFLLGRDLFDADCGLLAAALGAVSPAFILLSGSLLPHPVTMAALVFFAWAFLSARRPASSHPLRYAVLAGFALGLAVLARPWTALAVALPFIGITLCDGIRAIGRNTLCPYIRIYFPLVAVCLTVCSLLPLYNYAVTGSPFTNTYTLWWAYDTVGFGPGIGRGDGHSPALALLNAGLDLAAFQTALTGWPAPGGFPLVVLPLAAGLLFAPRGRRDLLLLLPPLALILAHLAYWARAGEFFGGRYYSEGMPFLWLLAARGLLKFSAGKWRLRLVQAALPLFLLWSVAFQIEPRFLRGYGLYDISRAGSDSVSAAGLRNAVVFVRRKAWTDYAAFSWLNDPYLDGDVVFARDLGPEKNTQVMQAFPGREAYYYDPAANENPLMPAETP